MEKTTTKLSKPNTDPAVSETRPKNPPQNAFPKEGYAVVVDGRIKSQYDALDAAQAAGMAIKKRFPVVQVAVLDAAAGTREILAL